MPVSRLNRRLKERLFSIPTESAISLVFWSVVRSSSLAFSIRSRVRYWMKPMPVVFLNMLLKYVTSQPAMSQTDHEDGGNVQLAYPELDNARLALESDMYSLQGQYRAKQVVKRTLQATGKAVMETVVLPHFSKKAPPLELARMSAVSEGAELSILDATVLRIAGDGWTDDICLDHRGLRVANYLDPTGNPVTEGFLPNPTVGEISFAGRSSVGDLLLYSLA